MSDAWAYRLMTNHVHILAVPYDEESLSRCISRRTLRYTQHVKRKYKRKGGWVSNGRSSFPSDSDRDAYKTFLKQKDPGPDPGRS